ncbi:DUF1684 domain-containing protein [soil metagenome]
MNDELLKMKGSRVIIVIGIVGILAFVLYSLNSGTSDEEYRAEIVEERRKKNDFMKNSDESPLGEQKSSFLALSYFEPDKKYRITANLEPIQNKKVVVLPTSSNDENSYLEYGWVEFELDGIKNRLLLLEVMSSGPTRGTLFLAFADETSAKETYGGGRYLELKKIPAATTITLDFNNAYNPYCAYNENFSCPLPPRENILKVAIRAGEKSWK